MVRKLNTPIHDAQQAGKTAQNVDFESKRLYNVSVCSEGEARGHGVFICKEFLHELADIGNAKQKVKCHISHYNDCTTADPLITRIGYAHNFRIETISGKTHCIADIVFVDNEHDADIVNKILTYAQKEPQFLGISIVFSEKGIQKGIDEYGEPIFQPESYPDPEGRGRHFCTISELHACDIVGDPAIGDNLFSETFFTEASYATKMLKKIKQSKKPLYERILQFAKKEFNLIDKTEMEKSKKALLNAFTCACQSKGFGEAQGQDGLVYRFPGDAPAVGDVLVVVQPDGTELPAEDGSYVMQDGTVVVVTDGIISEVVAPTVAEPEGISIEAEENKLSALQKQIEKQEKAIQELLKSKKKQEAEEELNELEVLQSRFNAIKNAFQKNVQAKTATLAAAKQTAFVKKNEDVFENLRKALKASGNNFANLHGKHGFSVKKRKVPFRSSEELYRSFASTSTLPSGFDYECIKYVRSVYEKMYYVDPIFANTSALPLDSAYNITEPRSVKIPKLNISPIPPNTEILTENGLTSCDNNTDRVLVTASERTMTICGTQTAMYICAKNYRYLFENTLYNGPEELPAELIITAMLMNLVEREMSRMLFGKKGSTGTWCTGIIDIMGNDVLLANIPSTQTFQYGIGGFVAFSPANAISQMNNLVNAVPYRVRQISQQNQIPVKCFMPYVVWQMLLEALADSNNALANSYLDACCGVGGSYQNIGSVRYPYAKNYILELVPLEVFNDVATSPTSGAFLFALESEIYASRYDVEEVPMPRIGYDIATEQIIARVEYAGGANYVEPQNVVVVLPS